VGYLEDTDDTPFGQANLTHEQFHEETEKGDKGTILNQLGGERHGIRMVEHHTSCLAAALATRESRLLDKAEPKGTNWYILSSAWARHDAHVDVGGGYTVVETKTGGKLWMVLVPDVKANEVSAWNVDQRMADVEVHMDVFGVPEARQGYRWEGLMTEPGSTLCVVLSKLIPILIPNKVYETQHPSCGNHDQAIVGHRISLLVY
jgi:hypothetical protein